MSKPILVTGATGKQGGSCIEALLAAPNAKDYTILAVTRSPESASAKKLIEQGVKIVKGDLNDVPAIFENAKKETKDPIWGVFSVQVPVGKGASVESEETQGKAVVDGALAAGVKFFVYTSVDRGGNDKSYENPTTIPHFISKHRIEHHLVDKAGDKLQWTILRPVAFMDNLTPDFMGKGFASMCKVGLKGKPLQLVAVKDIGTVAANAFLDPEEYAGKGIALAGDELTFEGMSEVFESKTGQQLPTTFGFLAKGMMWAIGDVGTMFRWFASDGYGTDIKELKKLHPSLLSFGDWLDKESKFETKK